MTIAATTSLSRAFTLMEVMLAVVIFSVVVVAMNAVFFGAMRLREKTAASVEEALPLQQTLAILRADLQGIVLPGTNNVNGPLKSLGTTVGVNQQGTGPDIFTSTGVIDDYTPFGAVQKVTYYLKSPTNGIVVGRGKDLYRAVTRNLLATTQEVPAEQGLMNDVEQIQFFYYDGSQWKETWDATTDTAVLPRAIKVQLQLATQATGVSMRDRTPVEMIVPIVVQPSTNTTTTAQTE
jgi:type II secretion system protein J